MPEQPRADQLAQKPAAAPGAADAPAAATPNDPQKQCVKPGEFAVELRSDRNPVGAPILLATNFLPTNQRADIGVRAPFVDGVRYFAGIDYGDQTYVFKRQDAVTRRATEDEDNLYKMANHFQLDRPKEPTRIRFQSAIDLARRSFTLSNVVVRCDTLDLQR
ncbi:MULTISPECIES: hypothetical protein [unclassified Bradyrhizobium]|uniref:hypothetical protein n=1 Tax=unclassified Bradyrhizobium TaxID=2631580 RepID=UPI003D250134